MIGPVLLLIPPLTQLNTPYPSTAYLTGFLRSRGYAVFQADLGLEMVLALYSRRGLTRVFHALRDRGGVLPGEARQMLALEQAYLDTIEPVVRFLQGQDPSMAPRIMQGTVLPRGPRFETILTPARSAPSTTDGARHLATLYLEDLSDLVRETVAPQFALSRYAEHVGTSATSFQPLRRALERDLSFTDELMLEGLRRYLEETQPAVVGLTVPFPGNLYGALRIAQALKAERPQVKVVMGGGYVNTELRRLTDAGVFDYVDYVTLDDGERPLLCLLEHLDGKRSRHELRRTFLRSEGGVHWCDGAREPDFGMAEVGTPTYDGLPLARYLSVLDTLNPMHRLWSDGHWNKLTVAHGCYWKQCTFCDVGLDYIGRYEAAPQDVLADRIEALIAETGRRGFHFVDEAAPPAGLKALALTLLERGTTISWWGNIRFEAAYTPDLCRLLAASGCIAISAGLEAAADRLLAAMNKGITVDQTARVAAAFRSAGILVHAYLMYGLPGETIAETVEALERVRQLFAEELLQSAFWHRFVPTAHSPIGLDPAAHGIAITGPPFAGFAENDLLHRDRRGQAPFWLGKGLRKALYNYMYGHGLERDVRTWFDRPTSKPSVPKQWVRRALQATPRVEEGRAERRLVWIGGEPVLNPHNRTGTAMARLVLPNRQEDVILRLPQGKARWLRDLIRDATPIVERHADRYPSVKQVRAAYPGGPQAFDVFLKSKPWQAARAMGLLLV